MSTEEMIRLREELDSLRQEIQSLRAQLAGEGAPLDLVCSSLKVVTPGGRAAVQAGTRDDTGWIQIDSLRDTGAKLLLSGGGPEVIMVLAPNGRRLVTLGGIGFQSSPWSGKITVGHASTAAEVRLWTDESGGVLQAMNQHKWIAAGMHGNSHCDAPAPRDGSGMIMVNDGLGGNRIWLQGAPDYLAAGVKGLSGEYATLKSTGVVSFPKGMTETEAGPHLEMATEPPSAGSPDE
jgi:hypothetical protein